MCCQSEYHKKYFTNSFVNCCMPTNIVFHFLRKCVEISHYNWAFSNKLCDSLKIFYWGKKLTTTFFVQFRKLEWTVLLNFC